MVLPWRDVDLGFGPISTSLTAAETDRLRSLAAGRNVREVGSRNVLEVGSAYGYSAIVMALAGAKHVLAVDPHAGELPDSLAVMRANLVKAGVQDRVTIVLGESQNVLPALIYADAFFDLVFIDGRHQEDAVREDLHNARGLLVDGELAVHDVGEESCPGVRAAVEHTFMVDAGELVDTLWISRP